LAPNRIGQYGQLQEWLEDWDRPNDHHRHFSHLWGMYPGNEISVLKTPKLAKAVKKSLQMRGEGGVGFGMAWQMCIWARMYEAETAQRLFNNLIHQNTFSNLFNHCYSVLLVDGNLGTTAAIAEMLLQSHLGEIHLLPALPAAWPRGSVRGLRARGGFEVDMTWKDGKLSSTTIRSKKGNPCMIRYNDTIVRLETMVGESLFLNGKMKRM
jgi:alpha-L-fucosidase 2